MMAVFSKLNKIHKKIIATFFIAILIISVGTPALFFYPKKADAQLGCASSLLSGAVSAVTGAVESAVGLAPTEVPTAENAQRLKEGCLDEIAWAIAKIAVQKITESLVTWINSGFNGNPAFVTDPIGFFSDIGDQVLGNIIQGSSLGFICSPFQLTIKAALIQNQMGAQQQASCTLGQIGNNFDNFVANLAPQFSTSGGTSNQGLRTLDDWYNLTSPGGNYYGAYEAANASLEISLQTALGEKKLELDWGNGFLSWRDCSGSNGNSSSGSGSASGAYGNPNQSDCPIVTPGSVIASQLNHTLGLGADTLVTADEINEIISALFSQLLGQVFGAAQGLLGTSGASSSFNGGSYFDALGADSNGQFNSSRDLSSAGISNNISILQGYIATKNQSLALVNAAIATQNQVAPACGMNSSQANSAQSVITTQLTPLATGLQTDINTANGYVAGLNGFKAQLAALGPSDTNGFNQVLSSYTQYLNQFNLDSMPILATNEKTDLPKTLNPLNQSAQASINQCNVAATGGTTGTTGGGGGSGSGGGNGGNAGGAQNGNGGANTP